MATLKKHILTIIGLLSAGIVIVLALPILITVGLARLIISCFRR